MPCPKEKLKPAIIINVPEELQKIRQKQHHYANQSTKPRTCLEIGDKVSMQKGHREWCSGTVVEKTQYPRSVIVETSTGSTYRRNLHHLRRSQAQIPHDIATNVSTPTPSANSNTDQTPHDTASNVDTSISQDNIVQPTIKPSSSKGATSNEVVQPIVTRYGRVVKPIVLS